jgi:hypothetical protein
VSLVSAGDGLVYCSECDEALESVIFDGEIRVYCPKCYYEVSWLDMLAEVGAVPVTVKLAVAPNVTVEVRVEKDLLPGSVIIGHKGELVDIEEAGGEQDG